MKKISAFITCLMASLALLLTSFGTKANDDRSVEINWGILKALEAAAADDDDVPQEALLSPSLAELTTDPVSLIYDGTEDTMSKTSRALLSGFIINLKKNQRRVELKAYGGDANSDAATARRIALRRGVALRTQLIEEGLAPSLVRLTIVGIANAGDVAHRIDIMLN